MNALQIQVDKLGKNSPNFWDYEQIKQKWKD